MDEHNDHDDLVKGLRDQLQNIFEESEQGIYIYHDDTHKICNKNFSDLLGYESPEEWSEAEGSFTDLFVTEESAETIVGAYSQAMEKLVASSVEVSWKKKDGTSVKTKVILVPVEYEDHLFALHFVSEA